MSTQGTQNTSKEELSISTEPGNPGDMKSTSYCNKVQNPAHVVMELSSIYEPQVKNPRGEMSADHDQNNTMLEIPGGLMSKKTNMTEADSIDEPHSKNPLGYVSAKCDKL